jgi:hypothetical protein
MGKEGGKRWPVRNTICHLKGTIPVFIGTTSDIKKFFHSALAQCTQRLTPLWLSVRRAPELCADPHPRRVSQRVEQFTQSIDKFKIMEQSKKSSKLMDRRLIMA